MRFVQWSLSGCKGCEVVRLFVSCGKHQLRRIRCHVKKKHVRKKKHVCHDCTCLVHCAIMIWTDEQGSHEINRIIVKAVFKQQLLRSIFTSALSSCVIVSVVCLHSSALIHNCRCQCVLCIYRKPFGGPADPVKNLDPILTGFWPKGGAARAAAH